MGTKSWAQIHAMAGMKSKIDLIADEINTFRGSSTNLNRTGFSGMSFFRH